MKKIILSILAVFMVSEIAFSKENCSNEYVENQIRKHGSKKEKKLLEDLKNNSTESVNLLASTYGSNARVDNNKNNDCKGIYFAKKAAEYGFSGAQYEVAIYYGKGKGVKKNLTKAKEWFKKSITTDDNPMALFYLADTYEKEFNYERAIYWYKRLVTSENLKKIWVLNLVESANKKAQFLDKSIKEITSETEFGNFTGMGIEVNKKIKKDARGLALLQPESQLPSKMLRKKIFSTHNIQDNQLSCIYLGDNMCIKRNKKNIVNQLIVIKSYSNDEVNPAKLKNLFMDTGKLIHKLKMKYKTSFSCNRLSEDEFNNKLKNRELDTSLVYLSCESQTDTPKIQVYIDMNLATADIVSIYTNPK